MSKESDDSTWVMKDFKITRETNDTDGFSSDPVLAIVFKVDAIENIGISSQVGT